MTGNSVVYTGSNPKSLELGLHHVPLEHSNDEEMIAAAAAGGCADNLNWKTLQQGAIPLSDPPPSGVPPIEKRQLRAQKGGLKIV